MKLLMTVHAGIIFLGMTIFSINTWQQSLSYGLGGVVMFANVAILGMVWDRLLRKKYVALSVSIIVIKYAVLGAILYKAFNLSWVDPLVLSVGIGSFGLSAVIYGLVTPNTFSETVQGNA
jgi:hypothetical protein